MADEEKVELVRASYAAWNRRDLSTLLDQIHPDYELVQADEVLGARTYRGAEGLKDLFHQFGEIWEEFTQEPTEFRVAGDRLAAAVHQRARGRESGLLVEQDVGHLLELRGQRVIRVVTYSEPAGAFRALEQNQ